MSKILIIDDEAIIRTSCERVLAPEGYEIKSATNGREGIALLEKEPFEVVLLDFKMPDMDGMEVLKKIKSTRPGTKIIMITGYSTVETAVNALRSGACNYLEKPFTPDKLISAIKEALENREDI